VTWGGVAARLAFATIAGSALSGLIDKGTVTELPKPLTRRDAARA
jgi:hypothetical protein